MIDNDAVLQLQVTKGQNQFLSTLAEPGLAQFLTFLKPCSILLPHVHQRANEFYSVIFGAHPSSLHTDRVLQLCHVHRIVTSKHGIASRVIIATSLCVPCASACKTETSAADCALTLSTACAGQMDAGISQENGAAQNITLKIDPGEVFVVPQGLMHYNHNQQCVPNVFFQSFSDSDPGALNVIGALAAFNDGGRDGRLAMKASGARSIDASPQGAFALDQKCLRRCGFARSGAKGDGLEGLPKELKAIADLAKKAK